MDDDMRSLNTKRMANYIIKAVDGVNPDTVDMEVLFRILQDRFIGKEANGVHRARESLRKLKEVAEETSPQKGAKCKCGSEMVWVMRDSPHSVAFKCKHCDNVWYEEYMKRRPVPEVEQVLSEKDYGCFVDWMKRFHPKWYYAVATNGVERMFLMSDGKCMGQIFFDFNKKEVRVGAECFDPVNVFEWMKYVDQAVERDKGVCKGCEERLKLESKDRCVDGLTQVDKTDVRTGELGTTYIRYKCPNCEEEWQQVRDNDEGTVHLYSTA